MVLRFPSSSSSCMIASSSSVLDGSVGFEDREEEDEDEDEDSVCDSAAAKPGTAAADADADADAAAAAAAQEELFENSPLRGDGLKPKGEEAVAILPATDLLFCAVFPVFFQGSRGCLDGGLGGCENVSYV
mmetsp:Transcript_61718/g.130250  ORF Transcript_61718/g.130250 Transcript_61718/m.130250 type:complete len:131 (+) Transcript_61718:2453-2845(+)